MDYLKIYAVLSSFALFTFYIKIDPSESLLDDLFSFFVTFLIFMLPYIGRVFNWW